MKKKFLSLETYRAFAALMIAAIHFDLNSPLVDHKLANGHFVQFFFTLSGFVIFYNYSDKIKNFENFFTFVKKRFFRLYPLHLFFLIVFLLIELFKFILTKYYGLDINSEIFEKWYIPGRFLYAEFIDWKYLYVSDESKLNKNNTIYSLSNDDSMYINDLINKIFYWIITLLVLLWIWLIFAPKKNK